MHVTVRPIAAPVALIEQVREDGVLRILVLRTGLVPAHVAALLDHLLHHVR